jgi:ABC-2 type transport system permease protein
MGEFVQKLSVVSPIKWTNQAIFRLIYNSDFSYVPVSIAVNLIISALLITVSSIVYRKEAVW